MEKNIILLITDTYRYDNLQHRANPPVDTPYLDAFLRDRATEITGCYTGSFPTIPHRTDVAQGRLGWPHYGWQPIEESGSNHIASMLGNAGYATQLICDCPHLFNAHFNQYFDAAYQHRNQEGDKALLHLNDPIEVAMPHEKTRLNPMFRGGTLADVHYWSNRRTQCEYEKFPAQTGSTAVRWLEENYRSGPFFLWVDLFDPHEPWDPPEYLVRRYDGDYEGPSMVHPNYGRSSDYTEAELHNLWSHYAAEAQLVDRWLGRILEKIDDLALWEDSVIMITSDHGFSIGEHDRTGKCNISDSDGRYWPIYPEVGHVPCLFAGKDIPTGKSVDAIVQPIDFLPTLVDLAGIAINPPEPIQGRSFSKCVLGKEKRHRETAVSGCFVSAESSGLPGCATTPFLVTEKWGYAPVGAEGAEELYLISEDPRALNNVVDNHRDVLPEMRQRFVSYLREFSAEKGFIERFTNPSKGDGSWAVDYT